MNYKRIGLIALAGTILGVSVVMTRYGLRDIAPLTLIALRLILATSAFAIAFTILRPPVPRERRDLINVALIGITSTAAPLLAGTMALQYVSSGVLTLFFALLPLSTGLMAHLWLAQEKLNRAKLTGLLVALGGVVLLLLTGTNGLSVGLSALDPRGPVLALGGVLLGSFGSVYTRRVASHINVVSLSAGQTVAAAMVLAPLGLTSAQLDLSAIPGRAWIAIGYTGLIGSFVAFLILFQLIRQFGATSSSLVTYLMPLVAGLLGSLLLDEVITPPLALGAVLILSGVVLTERPPGRRPAKLAVASPVDELRKDPCLMC